MVKRYSGDVDVNKEWKGCMRCRRRRISIFSAIPVVLHTHPDDRSVRQACKTANVISHSVAELETKMVWVVHMVDLIGIVSTKNEVKLLEGHLQGMWRSRTANLRAPVQRSMPGTGALGPRNCDTVPEFFVESGVS